MFSTVLTIMLWQTGERAPTVQAYPVFMTTAVTNVERCQIMLFDVTRCSVLMRVSLRPVLYILLELRFEKLCLLMKGR